MTRDYLTGEHFEYYSICPTKLWYHHHRMIFARNNQSVKLGSLVDKSHFKQEKKLNIGHSVVDFIEVTNSKVIISEVKKSSSVMDAHKLQILHYLFILQDDSNREFVGKIRYPKKNKVITIKLSNNMQWYNSVRSEIWDIVQEEIPEITWKQACKKCSMRKFCFS